LMLSQASPEEVERPHEKSDRIFGNRAEIWTHYRAVQIDIISLLQSESKC
jgi:hypothetical protein